MKKVTKAIRTLFFFYYDGFRNLSPWGRRVWLIVLIKLFIIFFVLKIFFFPDLLKMNFRTDNQRSTFVRDQLLNIK